jgi:transcriptional repressor NrdR
MRCPYCTSSNSQVKDSRPIDEHAAIRRRRVCDDCGGRFTTFERVQLKELIVVKRSGRREPFERDKMARSIEVALRKRSFEPERIERMVTGLVRQLESASEGEVTTDTIGGLVMDALKGLDGVAYVRFASVYKDFKQARDFHEVLSELARGEGNAASLAPGGASGLSLDTAHRAPGPDAMGEAVGAAVGVAASGQTHRLADDDGAMSGLNGTGFTQDKDG